MDKEKIVWILFIIITLSAVLIATNNAIIVKQRVLILIATYIIGMIAGFLGAFISLSEVMEEEDKQ